MRKILLFLTVILIFTADAYATSLNKRHQLGLKLGMWNQTTDVRADINISGVGTSVGNSGFIGGLEYTHWVEEQLAIVIGAGAFAVDISTHSGLTGVTSNTSSISVLQIGLKYYPLKSSLTSSSRPYVKGSIGTFVGSQSNVIVGSTVIAESRTENAFGGQLGVGADFILSHHLMIGISTAYNFITDFENSIGGSSNYSGPEFTLAIGWLF